MARIARRLLQLLKLMQRIFWTVVCAVKVRNCDTSHGEEVILWVWPEYPMGLVRYLMSDTFVKDVATYTSLSHRFKVRLVLGYKIGAISSKKIFFNYSSCFDAYSFVNHTATIEYVCKELEKQENTVIPPLHERELWENKEKMHLRFEKLGVRCPRSIILRKSDFHKLFSESPPIPFPFLIKEVHSCSSNGVHKVSALDDVERLRNAGVFFRNEALILQSLVEMRRDLRVIFVGDEVVLSYWRINPSREWKPTSSQHGSYIDFSNYPDRWSEHFSETFKSLEIATGAFDVTWEADNLESLPLYLEVSPNYQPNPLVDMRRLGLTYSDYKKSFRFKDSYDTSLVNLIFSIQDKVVKEWVRLYIETKKRGCEG